MHIVKESRKIIKPSTPTPPSLRQLKIGFIDEFAPTMSICVVLFFPINKTINPKFVAQLEKSLEKTLTPFYPLAGRYVEETRTIDCSDQGAEFITATADIKLQDLLDSKANINLVDKCIPALWGVLMDPLLSIQVTSFDCGGVAVGVSVTHKIVDISTLSTFLVKWGVTAREENEVGLTRSLFNSSSLFPARGFPPIPPDLRDDVLNKNVTLKFSFSNSMISNLKEKVVRNERNGTARLSKVQLVSALMVKGLIAVDKAIHNHRRDCMIIQPINLREKMASSIPKDSCGNIVGMLATECGTAETVEELAYLLRDSIKETINNYSKIHHDDEEGQAMVLNSYTQMAEIPPMTNVLVLTSWCRFPFYEVDFGFGKPVWASCGSIPKNNRVCLMDGMGGNGVDAYICLEVADVPHFEEALDMKVVST